MNASNQYFLKAAAFLTFYGILQDKRHMNEDSLRAEGPDAKSQSAGVPEDCKDSSKQVVPQEGLICLLCHRTVLLILVKNNQNQENIGNL